MTRDAGPARRAPRRSMRLPATLLSLLAGCLTTLILAAPATAQPQAASPASGAAATATATAQTSATSARTSGQRSAPDILGCKVAPTPEMPGRGVVGFFESAPKELPRAANAFAPGATTSIYEQYGYAGLRWNTYDLGCGPDLARSPDAAVGTAVANWIFNLPKTAVAGTGAVLGAAFSPDFLAGFDPLIAHVVDALQHAVFEQWFVLVLGAVGLLLIWKARQASMASSASAVGWALLVMVLVTMVFRWPLVAGHAADETVTGTLAAVSGGLNGNTSSGDADATATAGMQNALLYEAWLGGTFGDANSDVAKQYGPVIFDSQALTWREAQIVQTDPEQGKKIIEAKKAKFVDAATRIAAEDPDAYEYLTGRRSDSRVGYALLAGLGTLCAVPFLLMAGLLVLGALVIVRFGVMLFPAFATLGMFPTMRSLVTGIGSTVAAALINAIIFGIGAAVTVLGMGVLLSPSVSAAWLQVVLMLLLTIVMWVALSPFRRLTQMVSSRNHFAVAASGASTAGRGAARTSGRILTGAIGTFLGVSAAQRAADQREEEPARPGVPQRAEASTSYEPIAQDDAITLPGRAEGTAGPDDELTGPARVQLAAASTSLSRPVRIDSPSVTGVAGSSGRPARERAEDLDPDEIYTPAARSRAESTQGAGRRAQPAGGPRGSGGSGASGDDLVGRFESGAARDEDESSVVIGRPAHSRPEPERREPETARDRLREELEHSPDAELDELSEVFRPAPASPQRS